MLDITNAVRARLPEVVSGANSAGQQHGAGDASTPASNTGVTVAWMGVHWFAGTVWGKSAEAVAAQVGESAGVEPTALERGGYGYTRSYVVDSARVYWSPERADVFVSMSGDFCERLGVPGLVALATLLDLAPTSRLDVAWDCSGVEPGAFEQAFKAGDVVTRIHREYVEDTGRWKGVETRSNWEGDTVYLGSRHSERFVRVYDRRGPTRLEMEWKGARALALWDRLLSVGEEGWSREAMSELRAFLDFRDRSVSTRPSDCPLLLWWAQLVGDAGRSCLTIPRVARTLEDVRVWVQKQVAPALAMLYDGLPDFTAEIRAAIRDGRERYQRRADKVAMVAARGVAYGTA